MFKIICILISVALGFAGGVIYNIIRGTEDKGIGIAVTLIFCLVFITCHFIQSYKIKKTKAYKELKEYVNNQIKNIPEFKNYLKNIKLHISGEYILNAHATRGLIRCSLGWFILSYYSEEYMEYVKTSLCHELSHLSRLENNSCDIWKILCDFIKISMRVEETLICYWMEEFTADRQGCEWYGDKEIVLKKMSMMIQKYPDKKKISSHPTWEMRRKFIEEDVIPTEEIVRGIYSKYKEECNNL